MTGGKERLGLEYEGADGEGVDDIKRALLGKLAADRESDLRLKRQSGEKFRRFYIANNYSLASQLRIADNQISIMFTSNPSNESRSVAVTID